MRSAKPVLNGKYQLERRLASGGMGSIWRARDLELGRIVAVKLMEPGIASSGSARRRFEGEAKACALLRTPHVVQIYEYGVAENTPFIVMEYLEGEDLETMLRREHRLTLETTARFATQIAKGLRHAHDEGIVHRDLKPRNIFLAHIGEDEIVKIVDFGIAKTAGPSAITDMTRTGDVIGSPHYMSPEQACGDKTTDPRSDLWSLAVILYRCVTGSLPFEGEHLGKVIVLICTTSPQAPSALRPELSAEVDRFFEKAFTRQIAQRFQSASDLASAFARAAGVDLTLGTSSWSRRWRDEHASDAQTVDDDSSSSKGADPTSKEMVGRPTLPAGESSQVIPISIAPTRIASRKGIAWTAAALGALIAVGLFGAGTLRTSSDHPPVAPANSAGAPAPQAKAEVALEPPSAAAIPSAVVPTTEATASAVPVRTTHAARPAGSPSAPPTGKASSSPGRKHRIFGF